MKKGFNLGFYQNNKEYIVTFDNYIKISSNCSTSAITVKKDGNKLGGKKTSIIVNSYREKINMRLESIENGTAEYLTSEDLEKLLEDRSKQDK